MVTKDDSILILFSWLLLHDAQTRHERVMYCDDPDIFYGYEEEDIYEYIKDA